MRSPRRLALLLVPVLLLAGCVTGGPPARRAEPPPRVRCLSDPGETATRPLVFLFCIESP